MEPSVHGLGTGSSGLGDTVQPSLDLLPVPLHVLPFLGEGDLETCWGISIRILALQEAVGSPSRLAGESLIPGPCLGDSRVDGALAILSQE